jgi:hypothetical protein
MFRSRSRQAMEPVRYGRRARVRPSRRASRAVDVDAASCGTGQESAPAPFTRLGSGGRRNHEWLGSGSRNLPHGGRRFGGLRFDGPELHWYGVPRRLRGHLRSSDDWRNRSRRNGMHKEEAESRNRDANHRGRNGGGCAEQQRAMPRDDGEHGFHPVDQPSITRATHPAPESGAARVDRAPFRPDSPESGQRAPGLRCRSKACIRWASGTCATR